MEVMKANPAIGATNMKHQQQFFIDRMGFDDLQTCIKQGKRSMEIFYFQALLSALSKNFQNFPWPWAMFGIASKLNIYLLIPHDCQTDFDLNGIVSITKIQLTESIFPPHTSWSTIEFYLNQFHFNFVIHVFILAVRYIDQRPWIETYVKHDTIIAKTTSDVPHFVNHKVSIARKITVY
ncbi:CLUMA_CG021144, isoform A [Clunio marinus]|uniref:CLUMA_CG021144, isoform A n=1 Tax=Clunio marinus TaxID=568069 RepID=A0A1J1J6I6_9DIPT|nr:CLUMA_CG021144, isoform A [Clunio marinus]